MVNEVFCLHGQWFLFFDGKVTGSWLERGPAAAALSLLKKGLGSIVEGTIKWRNIK